MKELGEDLQDLLDQVELADTLEDLEPGLISELQSKMWVVNLEVDNLGRMQ